MVKTHGNVRSLSGLHHLGKFNTAVPFANPLTVSIAVMEFLVASDLLTAVTCAVFQ